MIVSIRDSAGNVTKRNVKEVWVQAVHSGTQCGTTVDEYRLLLTFGDYCKADEGCCDDPWSCDCDQETRGLVYFRGDTMFITYDGQLPQTEPDWDSLRESHDDLMAGDSNGSK